ncbi:hypothetical protein PBAL39_17714 [Pedobacter sp. BAL39]|nr:hypothetical protein PBAL39_17714 [Pedobacter sp. BAL39]
MTIGCSNKKEAKASFLLLDVMDGFEPPLWVLQTLTSPLGHMTIELKASLFGASDTNIIKSTNIIDFIVIFLFPCFY